MDANRVQSLTIYLLLYGIHAFDFTKNLPYGTNIVPNTRAMTNASILTSIIRNLQDIGKIILMIFGIGRPKFEVWSEEKVRAVLHEFYAKQKHQ